MVQLNGCTQDIEQLHSGRKGILGCLLYQSLKFHYNVFLFVGSTTLGLLFNLISWFIRLIVQTFQLVIVIYRRYIFVYHYCECTLIYRPLSYPFRSMQCMHMIRCVVLYRFLFRRGTFILNYIGTQSFIEMFFHLLALNLVCEG